MIYIITNAAAIVLAAGLGTALLAALWRERVSRGVVAALFVAALVLGAILAGALILAPVQAGRWTISLGTAFIIWGGFVLPTVAATLRAHSVRWQSALGDAAAWLAVMLVEATTMQLVGLVHP